MTFRSNARISSPKHAKFASFLEQREYDYSSFVLTYLMTHLDRASLAVGEYQCNILF
jgi:hypothetical protein